MDFFIFLLYYAICTSILLIILYFFLKNYLIDSMISKILKGAFDDDNVDFPDTIHVIDEEENHPTKF